MKKGSFDERGRPIVRVINIQSGIVSLLLLLFPLPSQARSQANWKGTIIKEGDVTVVRNLRNPIYETPILELKEDLSLGGPDARGDCAFGRIGDFVVDDSGSIYVLDQQDSHIKAFDKDGRFVRTIGRRGQGPGEFESPVTLSFNRTTNELAVCQHSRRMSFFKPDGTFLRDLSFRGMWALSGRVDSRGNITITERVIDDQNARDITKKLGPDATVITELADSPAPASSKSTRKILVFQPASSFQLDQTDNVVYGFPRTYEILFFGSADAKLFKRITRDYDFVAVTAEEKKEMESQIPPGSGYECVFPKHHSAYERFFLSDLGHIFVQTLERTPDGKVLHDVFDAAGRFICRIPLKSSGVTILKGKYYALEEDEDGLQYVKRYAVTWKTR